MKVEQHVLAGDVVSVKFEGRLDAASVSVFERALQQLLSEKRARLVIDLANTSYISSSGMRALLTTRRQARAQGGDVFLCCLSPRVRQIFDMIGFLSVFGVYDQVDQAVQAFALAGSQAAR